MGLDCYVMHRISEKETNELWYGRKENEIHGWMQRQSGIPAEEFNCVEFPLDNTLLDQLERDFQEGNLVYTPGSFFGVPGSQEDIQTAVDGLLSSTRQALKEGKQPYYFSWW